MKKNKTKNFIALILAVGLVVGFTSQSFASAYTEIKKEFHKNYKGIFKKQYDTFLDSIGKKDFKDPSAGWCVMKDENKKLIIGASGVVYCGAVTDGIDLGYDIIGYGGATDEMIRDWIPKIKKKYDKIIYYAATNTLNLCTNLQGDFQFLEAQNDIFSTIIDIYKLLNDSKSELVIVEVKEIKEITGMPKNEQLTRFNSYAKILNDFFKQRGFKTYDIPYDMTRQYSDDGGHFSSLDVYKDLLK